MLDLLLLSYCFYARSVTAEWWSQQEVKDLPIRNVLILGKTGNGKSTTGNVFAGREVFLAADEMVSVTQTAQKMSWERFGVRYMFVDTPGIFDTERSHEDIFREITNVIYLAPEGFHAILFQLNPSSRFTAEEQRTVEGLIAVTGGREVLDYVALIFSHGDTWPQERISNAAKAGKLPKPLVNLIKDVGHRVVSIDVSSPAAKEESAQALHDTISRIIDRQGGRPYTNQHFEDAKTRMKTIALSVDPEGRIKAMESLMEQKEKEAKDTQAELQRIVAEKSEESSRHEEDLKQRLKTELELEFARRQMELQKAQHEERLQNEQKKNEIALREQQLVQQQAEMQRQMAQQQAEMQRHLAQQQAEVQRQADMHRQLEWAKQETQQVIYQDTVSRSSGSWCSIL